MKKFYKFICAGFLFVQMFVPFSSINNFVLTAQAQVQSQNQAKFAEKIKRIEKFVENQMRSEGTVGLTIGFVKDDFQWIKGFGYADLENKVPAKIGIFLSYGFGYKTNDGNRDFNSC